MTIQTAVQTRTTTTHTKEHDMTTMTTTETITTGILALHEGDAPAKVVHRTAIVEPDFMDDGMAYWIGDNGTVACDMAMLPRLAYVLESGSARACMGEFPAEHGLVVTPFDPEFVELSMRVLSKHVVQHSQWRVAYDTVIVDA